MAKTPAHEPLTESEPDAWAAFERAIDVVVKTPPQHRTAKASVPDLAERARALVIEVSALSASLASLPRLRPQTED